MRVNLSGLLLAALFGLTCSYLYIVIQGDFVLSLKVPKELMRDRILEFHLRPKLTSLVNDESSSVILSVPMGVVIIESQMADPIQWTPLSFLSFDSTEPFTLVILNRPILMKKEVMIHLWNKSAYRITVDGGTDRWFEWLEESGVCGVMNLGLPDLVTGDLDSIRPSTLATLQEKSICIESTPNQDYTDFCKAVKCIKERNAPNLIVAVCEVSGRLDQILSQLNTLHMHEECIVLLSSESATWLLRQGSHEINVSGLKNNSILSEDRWIGLLPVGAPTTVTTSGLKWNLHNQEMKFGGLVSTSNTYSNDPIIKIETDQPLIWSMGVCL